MLSIRRASLIHFLFLRLFVYFVAFAPLAKLLEFNFSLNEFFVFPTPIVDSIAFGTFKFYKFIL